MLNHFLLPWVGHLLVMCEREGNGVPGESQKVGEEGDLGCDKATTGGRGLVLA